MKRPIADIKVGDRHRKDFGNLNALANSILDVGLLQPIGITEDNTLIFGERRLRACRDVLGWTEIDVRVLDMPHIVLGENAENEVRKEFTPSERVAIAEAIKERVTERRGKPSKDIPHDCAELPKGQETRDFAAKKAGFGSHETYRRAKTVVEKAEPELVEAMDSGNVTIFAAHKASKLEPEKQRLVASGRTPLEELNRKSEDEERELYRNKHPQLKCQAIVAGLSMAAYSEMSADEFLATARGPTIARLRRVSLPVLAFLKQISETSNDKTGTS